MKDSIKQMFVYQDRIICLTKGGYVYEYYLADNTYILLNAGV